MQPPRDETLRTLLGDLYPNDSSGDGKELSSQLLQILSQSSGDGDMAEHIDPWDGGDVVLIPTPTQLVSRVFLGFRR